MEGDSAMLDNLITNPNASSHLRHEAIDGVVQCVIKEAKERSYKHLLAYSSDEKTLIRSATHGFKRLKTTMIGLDFS